MIGGKTERDAIENAKDGSLKIVIDPFDLCAACGHNRRAHDGRGCGKWMEFSAFHASGSRVVGGLCECNGFVEKSES